MTKRCSTWESLQSSVLYLKLIIVVREGTTVKEGLFRRGIIIFLNILLVDCNFLLLCALAK